MTRPYGLLRAGFPYWRTLGMRRITNYPVDVAFGRDGVVYILLRTEGAALIRVWSIDDAEQLSGDLVQISGFGTGDGQLQWPVQLISSEDGDLFVSDEATHRITRFNEEGDFVAKWGTQGTGPGELNAPAGIAFDSEGNLLVVDAWNNRIQRFSVDGKVLGEFGSQGSEPGQFDLPLGIHVDELGYVYVADWGNNRVQMFNQEGQYIWKFLGDATLSRVARTYMMTNAMPNRLREMGRLEHEKYLRRPRSVRVDKEFRLFVPDYESYRVQIYMKDAIPLDEETMAAPIRNPTLATT